MVVLLLSGAIIPLQFFPEIFRSFVDKLPFQAIYHIPLEILLNDELSNGKILVLLGVQIIWIIVTYLIAKLFFMKASRAVVINGG